jgi:hypothetical protein
MNKEMYFGSGPANYIDRTQREYIIHFKDHRSPWLTAFDPERLFGLAPPEKITPKTPADQPILKVTPYALHYDGFDYIYISKVINNVEEKMCKLSIRYYDPDPLGSGSTKWINLANYLILRYGSEKDKDNRQAAVLLTTYGDLVIVSNPNDVIGSTTFSMCRYTLPLGANPYGRLNDYVFKLTPTTLSLTKADGSLVELTSTLVNAASYSITSIGDVVVTDTAGKHIWGYFASLIEKSAIDGVASNKLSRADAFKLYQSAGFIEGTNQPVLNDVGKTHVLAILEASIKTCARGVLEIDITDYLKKYISENIKTAVALSTTGLDYANVKFWDHMSDKFKCSPREAMTININWMFNGNMKENKFRYGEKIILTSENDCEGSYGACINNERIWKKAFDAFPPTRTCYPQMALSCVSPSPSVDPSPSPSVDPSPSPSVDPSPSPTPLDPPENSWYENKLYIGLIAGGVFVFLLIFILVASSGKSSPKGPAATTASSNGLNKLPL